MTNWDCDSQRWKYCFPEQFRRSSRGAKRIFLDNSLLRSARAQRLAQDRGRKRSLVLSEYESPHPGCQQPGCGLPWSHL